MKIKLVVVDLELTKRQKRVLSGVLVGALALGAGAAAVAAVPKTFTAGETLTAADLNDNFQNLDERVTALEAEPSALLVGSELGETGVLGTDTVYTHADLALTAGTWLVVGNATLVETVADTCGLGLYDTTAGATIAGSMGAMMPVLPGVNTQVAFTTSHVITLAAPTTIRLVAFRNGASAVSFIDYSGTPSAVPLPHKLKAVRLR